MGIDWNVEVQHLHSNLPERLERLALMAERSDYWTDECRLMPAEGVADILWEALDAIKQTQEQL